MRKTLFLSVLALLPAVLFAQNDPAIIKDFYSGISSSAVCAFNDHLNVMQISTDKKDFDVLALDDQMQVLWKTNLQGSGIRVVKFKDKVAVVSSGDPDSKNQIKVSLIDPATGKVLTEKAVYSDESNHYEFPSVLTGDGAYLKICLRESSFERRIHVGLGVFMFDKANRQMNETLKLEVITLNDKLDAVSDLKLTPPAGTVLDLCANKNADLFISWLNAGMIEVDKYADGNGTPVKKMTSDIQLEENDATPASEVAKFVPSSSNNNLLYFGTVYRNQNKESELGIGSFDFSTGKKSFVTEEFSKDHIKALQKSFVPVDKKLDDADLGYHKAITLRHLMESNGTLIATITSMQTIVEGYKTNVIEKSALINGYDGGNLNLKFQQILPASSNTVVTSVPMGYHVANGKLYIIKNESKGINTDNAIYGCLDLKTGNWDSMVHLSKKKLPNYAYSKGDLIAWFNNSFVVPYCTIRSFSMTGRLDCSLQLNTY